MTQNIFIGNIGKGLTTNPLPFNIDNDAFPTLFNFYTWRGRVKRKRGTILLGQLERQIESVADPSNNWQYGPLALSGGAANLITGFSLESTSTITPGSLSLVVGANTYTEPSPPDGTLIGAPAGSGTINYATGDVTISGGGSSNLTGTFSYYPGIPVMGLRDFASTLSTSPYPKLLAFDITYAYQLNQSGSSVFFYSVSYYKGTNNPVVWSGGDYQQFWTTNFQGALWATNNKPGFHFVNGTYSSGSGTADITFNFKSGGNNFTTLVIGDKLWFNEWTSGGSTINGLVGTISDVTGAAAGNYVVTFSGSQTVAGTGIAELLTNSIPGQDGIRWYDGDPTGGTGIPTGTGLGWVNFAPPLTALTVSIDTQPAALYYLVGALMIVAFKDRLLFFSPYIQSSAGSPIQLQDVVIWSWNGTPYYNSIVPNNETFDVTAYYVDQTGKGGWLAAGISQPIITVNNNEDVLLVGFTGRQTRFIYSGNDLNPFNFFTINTELGASATFSGITLDRGGLTIGTYGIAITTQQSAQRIDLAIPDSVFQIQALNNGVQRINSARDFFKEWIYFSYPVNSSEWKFPTQTFLYNYRDGTWAIHYENYTAHGNYRKQMHYTWATIPFRTWDSWREPWNSGSTSALFPSIVAGNPQGYVLIKGQGTGEGQSGTILSISGPLAITGITNAASAVITVNNSLVIGQAVFIEGVGGMVQLNGNTYTVTAANSTSVTINVNSTAFGVYTSGGTVVPYIYSINHCLQTGDYLYFLNAIGLVGLNGTIGRVYLIFDANNFLTDNLTDVTGIYLGLGTFARLSQPLLQTKQFPVYWEQGRQLRLGTQKYLMDTTANAQVTVNIYLSQDPDDVWNSGSIVPNTDPPPTNNSLIYSQTLYTCPESTNIGLTPANTNLQMPTAEGQYQIWHRFNTSLIGDSVQVGITLDDAQMRNLTYATSEITLHAMVLQVSPGPQLA